MAKVEFRPRRRMPYRRKTFLGLIERRALFNKNMRMGVLAKGARDSFVA